MNSFNSLSAPYTLRLCWTCQALSEGQHGTDHTDIDTSPPRRFLRFGSTGASTVGISTGSRRDVGRIRTAVTAAQVRADLLPPRLQAVSALALPTLDVLAWN
eukprot:COSAG02_NODE_21952_length_769_cov_0.617910_2_plen_101_part_01